MIPCVSDYPPTEHGEVGPQASHSPISSPSLVEELMGMVTHYAACSAHAERYASPENCSILAQVSVALRSRLTALETELRELRRSGAVYAPLPNTLSVGGVNGYAVKSARIVSSPRTTEPL